MLSVYFQRKKLVGIAKNAGILLDRGLGGCHGFSANGNQRKTSSAFLTEDKKGTINRHELTCLPFGLIRLEGSVIRRIS
jgi:hypothetical protein